MSQTAIVNVGHFDEDEGVVSSFTVAGSMKYTPTHWHFRGHSIPIVDFEESVFAAGVKPNRVMAFMGHIILCMPGKYYRYPIDAVTEESPGILQEALATIIARRMLNGQSR